MNFSGFEFDEKTEKILTNFEKNGRLPHAVIIECEDSEKSDELAKFISMWSVCKSEDKPCLKCDQCIKASQKSHADIYYAYPEKKSETYTIEQIRKISLDSVIRPNDADCKIYIFEKADERLSPIAQNALLKILEEPPKNIYFFLLCKKQKNLLTTILSRCTTIKIESKTALNADAVKKGEKIINGIISTREYDLLTSLISLADKELCDDIIVTIQRILRDGLATQNGASPDFNAELARKLSLRATNAQLIKLIELTNGIKQKTQQYININLLTTWLCSEYRRILWQR